MTKWLALFMMAVLTLIDQMLKLWAVRVLEPIYRIAVIPDIFYLTFVRNSGAAFGILKGKTLLLSAVVALVVLAGVYLILSGRVKERFLLWTTALILGGGLGNLIDRVMRGYVVDYLDFSAFFNFPVFNFADCCVVAGAVLLLCHAVWHDVVSRKRLPPEGTADGEG